MAGRGRRHPVTPNGTLISCPVNRVRSRHATELPRPFHRPGWVYEEKYDGWRMVAEKVDSQVSFTSRNGLDHTRRFPELLKALADLGAPSIVLDGEVAISVSDRQLISRFEWLRTRPKHEVMTPPMYIVFDLLELDGMAAGWPPPRALPA